MKNKKDNTFSSLITQIQKLIGGLESNAKEISTKSEH